MSNTFNKLVDNKTHKEQRQFTIIACALSGVSLIFLWFLGIAGIALGARALMLSFQKADATHKNTAKYRIASIIAILAGIVSLFFGLTV